MQYDLCVLTGDYRGKTFGPFEPALEGVAKVPAQLKEPIFGVLGNHSNGSYDGSHGHSDTAQRM